MKKNRPWIGIGLVLSAVSALAIAAGGFTNDPTGAEYWTGQDLELPAAHKELVYPASKDQAGFTFFENVRDVKVVEGGLSFELTKPTATVGWGNYGGQAAPRDLKKMWPVYNLVVLQIRQSQGDKTEFTAYGWVDGRRTGEASEPVTLAGTDWQALKLGALKHEKDTAITPDGFELNLKGREGARIEIKSVKLIEPVHEGYVRHEFTIPAGKIWRAVADIGGNPQSADSQTVPYINGQPVLKENSGMYGAEAVDIASYLKPGKNCVGFYGRRIMYTPFIYMQAAIVMESGEIINVKTESDGSWKTCPDEQQGWNDPGFDASAWMPLKKAYSGLNYAINAGTRSGDKGRLTLDNPFGRYLFYPQNTAVVFEVRAPAGLESKRPVLFYLLERAGRDGFREKLNEATVKDSKTQNGSLAYRIEIPTGRLAPGVYTLALDLKAGDELLESRPREPFVVAAQHGAKKTAGKSILDGLDLELEDTVDFTNPADPHPWVEVQAPQLNSEPMEIIRTPTIVRTNGMTYRQTAVREGSCFSYRLNEFKHPGDFYLMELEYPDDARRLAEVWIVQKAEFWSERQTGAAYDSGGRAYTTDRMEKLYWIHVADPGVHSVDIYNGGGTAGAAAKSLKIYRHRGDLPALECGTNRVYGIHTERQTFSNGAGAMFGSRPPDLRYDQMYWMKNDKQYVELFKKLVSDDRARLAKLSGLDRAIADLEYALGIADRYAQYLQFIGQNMHIIGCYQYHEGNTPLGAGPRLPAARVPTDLRRVMAEVFNLNRIGVYAGLEVCQFARLHTRVNNLQVARGDDTVWMVDEEGKQFYMYRYDRHCTSQNWLSPAFQSGVNGLIAEMNRAFGHLPYYRGIHMLFGPICAPMYAPAFVLKKFSEPFRVSYDDVSFAQFQKAGGLKLPLDKTDPKRFEKRAQLVKNSAEFRDSFRQWRCQALYQYAAECLQALQAQRKDLRLLGVMGTTCGDFYRVWLASGRPFADYLKDFGVDLDLYKNRSDLCLGPTTLGWPLASAAFAKQQKYTAYEWAPRANQEVMSAFDNNGLRYLMVRTPWLEDSWYYVQGEVLGDWGYPKLVPPYDWVVERTSQLTSHPMQSGFNCREAFIQAIITADPNVFVTGFTDHALPLGHQSELRPIMQILASLPPERFAPVLDTGLASNVAIRKLNRSNESYVYVANPGYWPIDAIVNLKTGGKVRELVGGAEVKTGAADGGVQALPVALEPYGLAAFRIESPNCEVVSFSSGDIPARARQFMENMLSRVAALLQDPEIQLVLPVADRDFMQGTLEAVKKSLADKQYAAAWLALWQPRFWTCWQEFLEKAALAVARLPAAVKTAAQENVTALPSIQAGKATNRIVLDGKLDEADWQKTAFQSGFVTDENKPGLTQTAVNALYDKDNLYIAFACADRNPGELQAKAKQEMQIWSSRDDVAVMFIQPDETKPVYYQMAFNTGNTKFDQRNVSADRDYTWNADWQTAAADVGNGMWTAEVMIPFKAFALDGPGAGKWRVNFHRVFRQNQVDSMSWSSTARGEAHAGNWHDRNCFGRLEFE